MAINYNVDLLECAEWHEMRAKVFVDTKRVCDKLKNLRRNLASGDPYKLEYLINEDNEDVINYHRHLRFAKAIRAKL